MDTKKLRQKILDLAIRGKLVPQDPNDEPASVLLERIRAERERLIKEGKIKRSKKTATDDDIEAPFEIPESWEWCKFGEYLDVRDGTHDSPKYVERGIPFVTSKNLKDGKIDFSNISYISEENHKEFTKRSKVDNGDILFAMIGSIGNSTMVNTNVEFSIKNVALFKPLASDTNMRFVLLFLKYVEAQLQRNAKGGMQPFVPLNYFRNDLYIPLPPMEEQQRIVTEVERWFAVIDTLESNEDDLIKAIDQAKSKILDLAIHGKLVPQDPNDEPAIELLKRINPKFEPCDNALYENVPCGWEVCTINDIASSELGKTLDKEKNKGEYKPYLCSINVFWNKFNLTEMKQMRFEDSELQHYSIQQGDLVICEGGDAGRCAVWPYSYSVLFQNAIHRVRFKEGIVPYFFMYVIMYLKNNHFLDNYCKGVTIKHFTKTALLSLLVPLPPINEQFRIVAKIEELFAVLDSIKESLEA